MKRMSLAAALLLGGTLFAAQGMMSSFNDFDANGDGMISQTEFENTQQARMAKQAESGKMMRNAANAPAFGDIDANGDGMIDPAEFRNHQMNRMQQRPAGMGQGMGKAQNKMSGGMQSGMQGRMMSSFNDFDANGDGAITQTEFENAQQARMAKQAESGKMMRNAANAPAFGDVDTNGDGTIDPTEFKNHQMNQMQQRPGGQGMGKGMKCSGGGMGGPNR
ncbi:EF-hand domain-containing protein [Sulfurimonas diazotrophicus]|uniref:EF-hand domain-containing protein n=1 Tax=Sulfurimonas diazotrophicus TaxID=3131939 RepID=A0ABZ3HCS8_9BACT